MRNMRTSGNIFTRILTIVAIVLAAAVIFEQLYFMYVASKIESDTVALENLQSDVEAAQAASEALMQQQSDKVIAWRNAQGRLAFFGDGTGKVCYLTFSGGPNTLQTEKNLEVLKSKGVVGTWFANTDPGTTSNLDLNLCKQIESQGSAVGIGTYDASGAYLYYMGDSEKFFTDEFDKSRSELESIVGHDVKIARFPGCSSNIGFYSATLGKTLPQDLIKRGYQYFDANITAPDANPAFFDEGKDYASKETITNGVLKEARTFASTDSPICILFHEGDNRDTTTEALPAIIDGLTEMGCTFKVLTFDAPGFYQVVIN